MASVQKKLFKIREKKRELKRRIAQSQRDGGNYGTTGKCKKLQQRLAGVVRHEKNVKRKNRRR